MSMPEDVAESVIVQYGKTSITETTFPYASLGLEAHTIERVLGYRERPPKEDISRLIAELLVEAEKQVVIRCGYLLLWPEELAVERDQLRLDGHTWRMGKIIAGQLKGITGLALFVATIGQQFDVWSRDFFTRGADLEGYIADAIGSEIVEATVDRLEELVTDEAQERGLGCTNRFSPGYCEWHVSEQHALFALLPDRFCGISLTDSALMVPIKSVSGIIGMGLGLAKKEYQCSLCNLEDCYRRQV